METALRNPGSGRLPRLLPKAPPRPVAFKMVSRQKPKASAPRLTVSEGRPGAPHQPPQALSICMLLSKVLAFSSNLGMPQERVPAER